jgi:hypothetical protein
MRRIAIFLLIAASVFIFATLATKGYYHWNVQFESLGTGSMGMCDGKGFGGFTTYKSYDGEKLTFSKMTFSSETEASTCFDETLRSNGVVVRSREDLFDESGTSTVGERVEARNELDGPASGFVVTHDGTYIVEIASTSLRHALIFEKRVRKY